MKLSSKIASSLYNTPLLLSQQGFTTLTQRVDQFRHKLDTFQGDEKAFFSFFLEQPKEDDDIQNGVAVIEVSGIIQQKEDIFTRYFGDTSTEQLKRKIQSHLANDKVECNSVLDVSVCHRLSGWDIRWTGVVVFRFILIG